MNKNNIKEYSSSNDNILIDNDIKNLILLSTNSDINVLKKKKQPKSKKNILKESELESVKVSLDTTIMISNLAKLNIDTDNKIEPKIIDYVSKSKKSRNLNKDKYIECYSNE